MRTREAKTGKGRGNGKNVEAADIPQNAYPTTAEALRDLARYLGGQEDKPDADLQLENIVQDFNVILDDELLESLEAVFEDAVFSTSGTLDEGRMGTYTATYMLMKKLRDLQKTRLRDAIGRALKLGVS